jgi:hypothetical protein
MLNAADGYLVRLQDAMLIMPRMGMPINRRFAL